MGEDLIENEIYVAELFGSDLQGNDLYKLEPLKQIDNATFVKVTPEFKRGDILKSTITPELTVIFDEKTFTTTKAQGKRWNAETKCIEGIPKRKFKAGDKVRVKRGVDIGTNMCDGLILTVSEYHNQRQNILYCKGFPYLFREDWLEPYVEELKKGDLAIFWGDNNLNPTIRLYHVKSYNGHSDNFGTVWDNAVKWDGTKEQFEKILRGEI